MTDYSLDTSTLSQVYRSYYKGRFPTFWSRFDALIISGRAVSVSEVEEELRNARGLPEVVKDLKRLNDEFFSLPTSAEQDFVSQILGVRHFRNLISAQAIQKGTPVADPFVIAKAGASPGMCVVTEERGSPNAAKIPNVCEYFGIDCINLEQLMEREGWLF